MILLASAVFADVSHLQQPPSKEYLPPFKPDESPGYKYPEPTTEAPVSYPGFAPTKDIYIPPVRLPLANEVYEPLAGSNAALRPINQSPIVNSANFPPYFQTTSQDLIYPSDPKHPAYSANLAGTSYYTQQTQALYHPAIPNPNPSRYPPVQYPPSGSIFAPTKENAQPPVHNRIAQSDKPSPAVGPTPIPDFATPPVATTFPAPTYKPLIFRDPTFGVPTRAPLVTPRYP